MLAGLPDVVAVAVAGVRDPLWSKTIGAVVVVRDSHGVDAASLVASSRERIAAFMLASRIRLVASRPTGRADETLKSSVREILSAADLGILEEISFSYQWP